MFPVVNGTTCITSTNSEFIVPLQPTCSLLSLVPGGPPRGTPGPDHKDRWSVQQQGLPAAVHGADPLHDVPVLWLP